MLIQPPPDIASSEITEERIFLNRREFIHTAAGATLGVATGGLALGKDAEAMSLGQEEIPNVQPGPFGTDEPKNSFEDITSYNNYYEFGLDKRDPSRNAHTLTTSPWTIRVDGHVAKPADYHIEDLLKGIPLEERVYRLRCVEAWSMVIPWVGFPLSTLINRFQPTSKAKYVEFTTVLRLSEMPGVRRPVLDWPYVEGLRDGYAPIPQKESPSRNHHRAPPPFLDTPDSHEISLPPNRNQKHLTRWQTNLHKPSRRPLRVAKL